MKKILPIVFAILFAFSAFSQKKTSFTGWSFTAEVGANYFDGDIPQELTQVFPTSFRTISSGGTIEYALTPIWGLSLDFYFFPLKAPLGSDKTINNVNTNLLTSDLNATINFTRWIFPESKSKVYVIGSLGLGFAQYDFKVLDNNLDPVPSDAKELDGTNKLIYERGKPLKTGRAGSAPVTLAVEYNFSKYIASGLRLHYRAYTKDNLEGITRLNWAGVTNDFIAAGQLYLRYKLNIPHKDHKRNIRMEEYIPNPALELAKATAEKLNKLDTALNKLAQKVDSQGVKLDSMAKTLSNDGPDTDGDGVPDGRDKDPNTAPNTVVDFWGKPIGCIPACPPVITPGALGTPGGTTTVTIDDIPAVYFDFDQIGLDNDALVTIRKVSAKMKADTTLMVEVRGYCDYMGNTPYNELLSIRRSNRVKDEMVKVWGIKPERIITNGKGKIIEPRTKYRPNRRCDFFFNK